MKSNVILSNRSRRSRSNYHGGRMGYILLFTFFFVILAAVIFIFFRDLTGPEIVMTPMSERISLNQEISLKVADASSSVRSISASVRYSGEALPLFEKTFAEERKEQSFAFSLKNSGLKDGAFTIEIVARDTSRAGFGRGNSTTLTHKFVLDTQPPKISLRTAPTSLRRGGAAFFAYSLSEEVQSTGIEAGGIFFPAYPLKDDVYGCLFAFPLDAERGTFAPRIVARDKAGNESSLVPPLHLQDRKFRADRMNISDAFLNKKKRDFEEIAPDGNFTPLERYVFINQKVRLENAKTLRELASRTSPVRLWSDDEFQRLPGSALRANFGDSRTYYYKEQPVDHQTHMGLDLASVAHAPVPASNDGKVIFAAPLGIFGNLVIVDHGMGLMSLYSHMSEIAVSENEHVKKGQIIAYTGMTGLAGGDHLHFGMLVNGIQVQPIEWLDKNWVRAAISGRIEAALKR